MPRRTGEVRLGVVAAVQGDVYSVQMGDLKGLLRIQSEHVRPVMSVEVAAALLRAKVVPGDALDASAASALNVAQRKEAALTALQHVYGEGERVEVWCAGAWWDASIIHASRVKPYKGSRGTFNPATAFSHILPHFNLRMFASEEVMEMQVAVRFRSNSPVHKMDTMNVPAINLRPAAVWGSRNNVWAVRKSLSGAPITARAVIANEGGDGEDAFPIVTSALMACGLVAAPIRTFMRTYTNKHTEAVIIPALPSATTSTNHDMECMMCAKDGGDLIGCDTCTRSIHASCICSDGADVLAEVAAQFPFTCPGCAFGAQPRHKHKTAPTTCSACGSPHSHVTRAKPFPAPPLSVATLKDLNCTVSWDEDDTQLETVTPVGCYFGCSSCSARAMTCCSRWVFGPGAMAAAAKRMKARPVTAEGKVTLPKSAPALVCAECAAGDWDLEKILAHRIRFVPNLGIIRLLQEVCRRKNAAASAHAWRGIVHPAYAASFLSVPRLELLVKFFGHGHWRNTWRFASYVSDASKQLYTRYVTSNRLASMADDLLDAALRVTNDTVAPSGPFSWDAVVLTSSDVAGELHLDDERRVLATLALPCMMPNTIVFKLQLTLPPPAPAAVSSPVPALKGGSSATSSPAMLASPARTTQHLHVERDGETLPLTHYSAFSGVFTVPRTNSAATSAAPAAFSEWIDEDAAGMDEGDDSSDDDMDAGEATVTALGVSSDVFRREFCIVDCVLACRVPQHGGDADDEGAREVQLTPPLQLLELLERLRVRTAAQMRPEHQRMFGYDADDVGVPTYDPTLKRIHALVQARTPAHGNKQYLVRWKGLDHCEATWEMGVAVASIAPAAVMRFYSINACTWRARSPAMLPPALPANTSTAINNRASALPAESLYYDKSPDFLRGGALFPYQLEGFNWLLSLYASMTNGILADDMGLGKTVQAIAFMEGLYQLRNSGATKMSAEGARNAGPHLLIVPKSTLGNWVREAALWAPGLVVCLYQGVAETRAVQQETEWYVSNETTGVAAPVGDSRFAKYLPKFDVLLTTYDVITRPESNAHLSELARCIREYGVPAATARADGLDRSIDGNVSVAPPAIPAVARTVRKLSTRREADDLWARKDHDVTWASLIVDEGHRLKNVNAKLFTALSSIAFTCRFKLLMTGTPIQNHMGELFSLLHFLHPGKFGTEEEFQQAYNMDTLKDPVLHAAFTQRLRPHMLRRTKAEVMTGLPAKHEVILPIPMSPLQAEMTRIILEKEYELLQAPVRGSKKSSIRTVLTNVLMELRKIGNHPYLLPGTENMMIERSQTTGSKSEWTQRDTNELFISAGSKFALLVELLPTLARKGHRVLIFSQFKGVLTLIEDLFELMASTATAETRLNAARIDGSTPGDKRQRIIDTFNRPDSPLFALLMTTRAGGQGLNLAAADTVIIFDSDWNPHMDRQAAARAHRFGQRRPVVVYRLLTQGSVEQKIFEVGEEKCRLEEMTSVGGGRDGRKGESKTRVSDEDLRQIMRASALAAFAAQSAEAFKPSTSWVSSLVDDADSAALAATSNKDAVATSSSATGGGMFAGLNQAHMPIYRPVAAATDGSATVTGGTTETVHAAEEAWKQRFVAWRAAADKEKAADDNRGRGQRQRRTVVKQVVVDLGSDEDDSPAAKAGTKRRRKSSDEEEEFEADASSASSSSDAADSDYGPDAALDASGARNRVLDATATTRGSATFAVTPSAATAAPARQFLHGIKPLPFSAETCANVELCRDALQARVNETQAKDKNSRVDPFVQWLTTDYSDVSVAELYDTYVRMKKAADVASQATGLDWSSMGDVQQAAVIELRRRVTFNDPTTVALLRAPPAPVAARPKAAVVRAPRSQAVAPPRPQATAVVHAATAPPRPIGGVRPATASAAPRQTLQPQPRAPQALAPPTSTSANMQPAHAHMFSLNSAHAQGMMMQHAAAQHAAMMHGGLIPAGMMSPSMMPPMFMGMHAGMMPMHQHPGMSPPPLPEAPPSEVPMAAAPATLPSSSAS